GMIAFLRIFSTMATLDGPIATTMRSATNSGFCSKTHRALAISASFSLTNFRRKFALTVTWLGLLLCALATQVQAQRRQTSEDRDLKELNLTGWDCLNRPFGTAKTPDGQERNRMKNRSAPAEI